MVRFPNDFVQKVSPIDGDRMLIYDSISETLKWASWGNLRPSILNYRGAWDSNTTYAVMDVVLNDSIFYMCILESTNNEPPNATYWTVVANNSAITVLDNDITQADGKYIATDKIRARDGDGLALEDDGGNGITIADGGLITLTGHELRPLASSNMFFGQYAGYSNTTGYGSSFFGLNAGHSNTEGYYNSFFGVGAGLNNTTGYSNSFFGLSAGLNNTTGYNNSFFGLNAGLNNTTGMNLTCVGHNAQPSAADATNEITLGDTNITSLRCKVTSITGISDERDKTNIATITTGLGFVRALKPRSWVWAIRDLDDEKALPTEGGADIGFVAQDLDALQKSVGVDLGLVQKNNPDRWESTPGRLIPIMVNAIQELADEIDMLKEKLT